ncbi:MAG: HEAT repeat domain-containing protein [Prevotella sp.]|nr:HEAT repeat domain-containing protein [Prevotella sp.]
MLLTLNVGAAKRVVKKVVKVAEPVVIQPQKQHPTAFAVITDKTTFTRCNEAILKYRDAVEYDGLSTYIIHADWQTPDEVRGMLQKLYGECPTLEGIVLVGDIPIAMVRNAQHMTTAFKMDEAKFPIYESSVPTDRFYDDLHLQFRFMQKDSANNQLFYYQLTEESPQSLQPTFYSARIKYPEGMGGDKYEGISAFLTKAANAKYQLKNNQMDEVVTYNGGSYNYDCLMVYMDEEKAYRENFPLAFRNGLSFKHWNFRMQDAMKYKIFSEMQRKDIDLFMFHEHGNPDSQLVNDNKKGTSSTLRYDLFKANIYSSIKRHVERKGLDEDSLLLAMQKKFDLTPEFFKDYKNPDYWKKDSIEDADVYITLKDLDGRITNPTMVMFDACYNGSFHEKDQIAGRYIFNPGTTLVVQGNTRNVLQDRWTIEMVGLLSHGLRVGQYNRQVATLEGHLLGDPTVHFAPIKANSLTTDVVTRANDAAYWRNLLNSKYADIQCLALRKIADCDKLHTQAAFFLEKFKESTFNTVRMECLKMLSRYNDKHFIEAVRIGLRDPYERVARSCADYAGEIAAKELIPDFIETLMGDEERIRAQYALNNSLYLFDGEDIIRELQNYFDKSNRINVKEESKKAINALKNEFQDRLKRESIIFDKTKSDAARMSNIRMLRNYPRTGGIPRFLSFIADSGNPLVLRVAMAEALGWFNHSVERPAIINGCKTLLEKEQPSELKAELIQTINRLQ